MKKFELKLAVFFFTSGESESTLIELFVGENIFILGSSSYSTSFFVIIIDVYAFLRF